MGASHRKEAVAYFNEFAIAETPPSEQSFTAKLTLYSSGLCSGSEFFSLSRPIVEQLVASNKQTRRLQWLLTYVSQSLEAILGGAQAITPAHAAALWVAEMVIRHVLAMVKGNSTELLTLVETKEGPEPSSTLCGHLVSYIVRVNLDTTTALVHVAVARLLLTLTSSALHHDTAFAEERVDLFTEMVMSNKSLTLLLGVLLDRAVAWGAGVVIESPRIYAEGCEPGLKSFLGGMLGGGANRATEPPSPAADTGADSAGSKVETEAVYFSVTNDEKSAAKNIYASCTASERALRHSVSLLAVLVAHQKGNGRNPALDYLVSLNNTSAMPFSVILRSLGNKMPACPAACMLLYVFLHDHPTFVHDTLRTSQNVLLSVVESILRTTYIVCVRGGEGSGSTSSQRAAAALRGSAVVDVQDDPLRLDSLGRIEGDLTQYAYPFINFMTSTLMLVLSQDRVVNQMMCDTACTTPFTLDRHQHAGTRASVGSLAVQVLCTGIIRAVNERNEPLAAVFAPCMANMAVFVKDLDTYTSQKVVGLLLIMLRKVKLVDAAYHAQVQHGEGHATAITEDKGRKGTNPYASEDAKGLVALGDMLLRQLRMVVESIEGMLRGGDRNNESLIYELLYEHDRIVIGGTDGDAEGEAGGAASAGGVYLAQARQVLGNLIRLITSYTAEIASAPNAASPKEILAVIKRCSQNTGSNNSNSNAGGTATTSAAGGADGVQEREQTTEFASATQSESKDGAVDLFYSYEESPHSYDFFGPFVWATLLSDARWPGGLLWCNRVSELSLFSQ